MTLDCIAIDDEPLALSLMDRFAKKIPYLNLVNTFESAFDAIHLLKKDKIDLLFLDVQMPDVSGIQFIKTLTNPPMTIFTSAFEKYAIESYDLNAVDYLLKPFAFERFFKAVDKAHSLKMLKENNLDNLTNSSAVSTKQIENHPTFIFVKSEHNLVKIDLQDIKFIESIKDYLKIHLLSQKNPVLTICTLKSMYETLDKNEFVRVHRSFIVPIQKIKSIRKGRIMVLDSEIPIGDLYAQDFYQKIGLSEM